MQHLLYREDAMMRWLYVYPVLVIISLFCLSAIFPKQQHHRIIDIFFNSMIFERVFLL